MTRDEKVAEAKRLKATGLTNREIAERLGFNSTSTVTKMLNPNAKLWRQRSEAKPERKAAKRQWDRDHRPPCVDCGNPAWRAERCRSCHDRNEAERVAQRGQQIARWWAEGLTLAEIGERLGWTANHVQVEIQRLRKKGHDIPHRYRVRQAA